MSVQQTLHSMLSSFKSFSIPCGEGPQSVDANACTHWYLLFNASMYVASARCEHNMSQYNLIMRALHRPFGEALVFVQLRQRTYVHWIQLVSSPIDRRQPSFLVASRFKCAPCMCVLSSSWSSDILSVCALSKEKKSYRIWFITPSM